MHQMWQEYPCCMWNRVKWGRIWFKGVSVQTVKQTTIEFVIVLVLWTINLNKQIWWLQGVKRSLVHQKLVRLLPYLYPYLTEERGIVGMFLEELLRYIWILMGFFHTHFQNEKRLNTEMWNKCPWDNNQKQSRTE